MSEITIEMLSARHDRSGFDCGEEALNRYLHAQSGQDSRRRTARIFVAAIDGKVIGFYTLSATLVSHELLPETVAKKLPRYPIPAVLIGRLAVDRRFQKKKLGGMLLVNAMKRALRAGESVGMFALIVDAKNASVKAFYEKYGFLALKDTLKLFLPLDSIAECE